MTVVLPIVPFSEDDKRMFMGLGLGLVRWQYIESGLFLIAAGLIETNSKSTSLAFFEIKNASNKLEFVDRLIYHKLSQWTRTRAWKPIADEITAAIDFRNALAHFEVFKLTDEEFAKNSTKNGIPNCSVNAPP